MPAFSGPKRRTVGAVVYVLEEERMWCSRIGAPKRMRIARPNSGADGVRRNSRISEKDGMVAVVEVVDHAIKRGGVGSQDRETATIKSGWRLRKVNEDDRWERDSGVECGIIRMWPAPSLVRFTVAEAKLLNSTITVA